MDGIAKLIINSCDHIGEESFEGQLGEKLIEHAKEKLKSPQEIDSEEQDRQKIEELKKVEKQGDLCWIAWSSYQNLPHVFRYQFEQILDPLSWIGFYFSLTQFHNYLEHFLKYLGNHHALYLLEHAEAFQIVVLSGGTNIHDYLSSEDINRIQNEINTLVVYSIGFNHRGERIEKKYQRSEQLTDQ